MRRTLLASLLIVVPSIAFALDYTDVSSRYTDAPFSSEEAAGISLLTNLEQVEGNPDGTFAPQRTLNRAEFAKIAWSNALESTGFGYTGDYGIDGTFPSCFPDVSTKQWFGPYVCVMHSAGIIQGNPDGLFHPEREINYVEALKILDLVYGYPIPDPAPNVRWAWYTPYMIAAQAHGVLLTEDVKPDAFLTRGQMARLAASFAAANAGELDTYRAAERGETVSSRTSSFSSSSSRSSASSFSSSFSSSSSSYSLSSQSSSASSLALSFPAVSHFITAGTTTPVLYDGVVQPTEEVKVTSVELELFREIHSLNNLQLVDQNGRLIANLAVQNYSNTSKTKWRADFSTGSYILAGSTPTRVAIVAMTNGIGQGAASNELVQFKTLRLFTVGTQTNASQQLVPTDIHAPSHQTSFGRMTGAKNTMGGTASVVQGTQRQIGNFTLTAQRASGATLFAKSLFFELQSADVSVSNVKIGTTSVALQSDCATEQTDGKTFLTCLIPDALQQMSTTPVTLSVFANTSVASAKQTGTLRLVSPGNGSIGQVGMVNWTDGSGAFNWMEADFPADSGPLVTVTK